jgi:hypothetical protein
MVPGDGEEARAVIHLHWSAGDAIWPAAPDAVTGEHALHDNVGTGS